MLLPKSCVQSMGNKWKEGGKEGSWRGAQNPSSDLGEAKRGSEGNGEEQARV